MNRRICKALGLSEFDLSNKEIDRIENSLQNTSDSTTVVRSSSFEENIISPSSLRKMSAIFDISPLLQLNTASISITEPGNLEPDSHRKMSAIFDITEYALAKSPPESPIHGTIELASAVVNSESGDNEQDSDPPSPSSEESSPRSSCSSYSKQRFSENGESSASETESDYSDVFTENVSFLSVTALLHLRDSCFFFSIRT